MGLIFEPPNDLPTTDSLRDKKEPTELAPGDVTDFIVVLTQLDKGRAQLEATNALHEVVAAALTHEKKGGTLTLKLTVKPIESESDENESGGVDFSDKS